MARGWHYTKLSLSSALLLSFSGICNLLLFLFLPFLFCFVMFFSLLSLELCRLDVPLIFSGQQTSYRIGNHVYYWVWLRPDRLM